MADAVVQAPGGDYRDVDILALIPFKVQGQISKTDKPFRMFDTAELAKYQENKDGQFGAFYLYNTFTMMTGTASFLVYAKAKASSEDKGYNGSLLMELPLTNEPSGISFKPDPICSSTAVPAAADALAKGLTRVANAQAGGKKWSDSKDAVLEALYQNFIGQGNDDDYMIMAGSSANVKAHVCALRDVLDSHNYANGSEEAALKTTILSLIDTEVLSLVNAQETADDYPASLGLPDGAAALCWKATASAFEPQLQTTTKAPVNTITRYCYPPELFYFANSRICTSEQTEKKESYYQSERTWADLLKQYEYKRGIIQSSTKAAAIVSPLQYAVAQLQVTMSAESSQLKDRYGHVVNLTSTAFPLTGMIVCNQHSLGFDFKPEGAETHADDCFIYDSQVRKADGTPYYLSTSQQTVPSTLVLQNYDGETVTVILEFRNDSGVAFQGKEGIVYPETKFYLIGRINPADGSGSEVDSDVRKRVFTQDHITKVNMIVGSVQSLPNAYNVLPDVLGGRLEVGIELTPKWTQATTTTVILE